MKKLRLFLLLAITIAHVSCSKQNETATPEKADKLYDVNLSVSTFSTEIVGLTSSVGTTRGAVSATTATNAVGDQISNIKYLIYNSSGVLVKNVSQSKILATFGTITEQLPAGDYRIYVIGSTELFSFLSEDSSTNVFVSPSIYNIGDWFMNSINIKVTDESLSQSVTLDRLVGKLEVQITDAIPTGISKVTVSSTSSSWFYLNSTGERGTGIKTVETNILSTDIGKTNFLVSNYVLPLTTGSIVSDVSIRAYNSSGGLIVDKIVKSVKIEKNKKTILTGKLFTTTAAATSGFAIQLNSDWNTESNTVTF